MLVAKDIFLQIKKITSNLIELGLCMDQNFPSMKKLNHSIEEVNMCSIESSYNSSIFLKNISYGDMYYELFRRRMYNIKMIDGALIQM